MNFTYPSIVAACAALATACGGAHQEPTRTPVGFDCSARTDLSEGTSTDVVSLATGQTSPSALVTDCSYLYWTNSTSLGGSVMRMPFVGGTPEPLVSDLLFPGAIAVDDTDVYFSTYEYPLTAGKLWVVGKTGGQAREVASALEIPYDIVLDDTYVYWLNRGVGQAAGAVMRRAKAGGDVETLASGLPSPSGIALDSENVYWTTAGTQHNDGRVAKLALANASGGTPEILAHDQLWPQDIALTTDSVYFSNGSSAHDGSVVAVGIDAGTPTPIADAQDSPAGVAVTGSTVYWANGVGATVERYDEATGAAKTLATNQGGAFRLVLGHAYVYWTNTDDGTVQAAPR